jgi:hypothetical protein
MAEEGLRLVSSNVTPERGCRNAKRSEIVLIAYTPADGSSTGEQFPNVARSTLFISVMYVDFSPGPPGFANPAFFPHHYLFVWGSSALPLRQNLVFISILLLIAR